MTFTKDTWVEATHEFTLEANTKVNLVVMVGKNPGQSVLIDDFSLQTNDGGLIEGDEPEQPEEPGDAIFSESFANGIGSFTTADIAGEQAWNADDQYKCMKMSGLCRRNISKERRLADFTGNRPEQSKNADF